MVEASPWLQTNWPQGPSAYGPSRQRLTFLIAWTWDLGDLSIDNEHIWNIYGKLVGGFGTMEWIMTFHIYIYILGIIIGTIEFYDFPIMLGMSSSQLTKKHFFQRGRSTSMDKAGLAVDLG